LGLGIEAQHLTVCGQRCFVTPTGEREEKKEKKGLLIRIQGMHALKVK
jgi:hypothetical protein